MKIMRCKYCGNYTLSNEICPRCGGPVESPHPPKYVVPYPEDIT